MKQLTILNPEGASENEIRSYSIREAVRAVVVDAIGNIALLRVGKYGHYKLPGGGIEPNEDHMTALKRECKEEIGCDIEVMGEVGEIIEYRKSFSLKQISFCYAAKVIGEKGMPQFTDEERMNEFELEWIPSYEVVDDISQTKTDDMEGNLYIVPRDTAFLREYKVL